MTHNQAVDAFRKATEKVVLVVEGGAEGTIKVIIFIIAKITSSVLR